MGATTDIHQIYHRVCVGGMARQLSSFLSLKNIVFPTPTVIPALNTDRPSVIAAQEPSAGLHLPSAFTHPLGLLKV